MAEVAAPPVPPKLKPIIKHWASFAGPIASSSRSSSTSAEDDSSAPPTIRSSASLPTRPPSPAALQNIKFAPLPHVEPRRRKSNLRLGVAARSRMIAARRGQLPPDWNEADDATREEPPPQGPLVEDPFEVFGRYVLVKGKNLWKRVSPKAPTPAAVVMGEVHCDPASSADTSADMASERADGVDVMQLETVRGDEVRRRSRDEDLSWTSHSTSASQRAREVWEEEIDGEQAQKHIARVNSASKKDKEAKKARRISMIRKESSTVES